MKNRSPPRSLMVPRATRCRIRGGRGTPSLGRPKPFMACEGRQVENDESSDFTALQITHLPVTTRDEISGEDERLFRHITSSSRFDISIFLSSRVSATACSLP